MDAERFPLQRFVDAQNRAGTYPRALAELEAGHKASHWMWFVFPQIAGLGSSATAREFAIASLPEAQAYLAHPLLGTRLRECCNALLGVEGRTASEILGEIDGIKLRSSMTLFAIAAPEEPLFAGVLDRYYQGEKDAETERRVAPPG
jgi:uncharacterized protein (DUF1810 family)